jgi:hypothetical protein
MDVISLEYKFPLSKLVIAWKILGKLKSLFEMSFKMALELNNTGNDFGIVLDSLSNTKKSFVDEYLQSPIKQIFRYILVPKHMNEDSSLTAKISISRVSSFPS